MLTIVTVCGAVKHKENPIYINGRKTYPRDKQTSINALVHANYDIVSLCSNCHNQIHYGIDSDKSSISLTYILSLESICTLVVERLSSNSCVHLFH